MSQDAVAVAQLCKEQDKLIQTMERLRLERDVAHEECDQTFQEHDQAYQERDNVQQKVGSLQAELKR